MFRPNTYFRAAMKTSANHTLTVASKKGRAQPGIEPGTPRTQYTTRSAYHTTRPLGRIKEGRIEHIL